MKRAAGFTLTELLITMTIVGVLLGIGVPSYRYVTKADRVSAEINGLLGDLQFARSEAVKEGQPVTVCPSSDGATCLADSTWNTGWLVWADLNNSGGTDPDSAGEILRAQQAFSSTDTLTSAPNTVTSVVFNREGFAPALGSVTVFTLKDATANETYTRCLTLQLTGQAATATNKSDPANCQ